MSLNDDELAVLLASVGQSYEDQRAELTRIGQERLTLIVACRRAGLSLRRIAALAQVHFTTVQAIVAAHGDVEIPSVDRVSRVEIQELLDELSEVVRGQVEGMPLTVPEFTYEATIFLQRALDRRSALTAENMARMLSVVNRAELFQISRLGYDPMAERRLYWRGILIRLDDEIRQRDASAGRNPDAPTGP